MVKITCISSRRAQEEKVSNLRLILLFGQTKHFSCLSLHRAVTVSYSHGKSVFLAKSSIHVQTWSSFAFQESLQNGITGGKLLCVQNLELNQCSNSPEVYRSSSHRLDIWLSIAWSRGACSGKLPAGSGSSVKALFQDMWTPKSSQRLYKTRMAFDSTYLFSGNSFCVDII